MHSHEEKPLSRHFDVQEIAPTLPPCVAFKESFHQVLRQVHNLNPSQFNARTQGPPQAQFNPSMPLYLAIDAMSTVKWLLESRPNEIIEKLYSEVQPQISRLAEDFITKWRSTPTLKAQLRPSPTWNHPGHIVAFWRTFLSQKVFDGHILTYQLDATAFRLWMPNLVRFDWYEANQMSLIFTDLKDLLDCSKSIESFYFTSYLTVWPDTSHPPGAKVDQGSVIEPFNYGFATAATRSNNPTFIASLSSKDDSFDCPEVVSYLGYSYTVHGRYEIHKKGTQCFLLMRERFRDSQSFHNLITNQEITMVSNALRNSTLALPEHTQLLLLSHYAIEETLKSEEQNIISEPLVLTKKFTQRLHSANVCGVHMPVVAFGMASGKFYIGCKMPGLPRLQMITFTSIESLAQQGVVLYS